jgi:hypothetical protein
MDRKGFAMALATILTIFLLMVVAIASTVSIFILHMIFPADDVNLIGKIMNKEPWEEAYEEFLK